MPRVILAPPAMVGLKQGSRIIQNQERHTVGYSLPYININISTHNQSFFQKQQLSYHRVVQKTFDIVLGPKNMHRKLEFTYTTLKKVQLKPAGIVFNTQFKYNFSHLRVLIFNKFSNHGGHLKCKLGYLRVLIFKKFSNHGG